MKEIYSKIYEYVKLNNEKYNRNLKEEEIKRITDSYLESNEVYDENRVDAFIETVKLKWADELRANKGDDLKNWRSLRRSSVVSGNTFVDAGELTFCKKNKETFDFLLDILTRDDNVTFSSMTPRQKKRLVETMFPQRVPLDTYLIREGDNDNRMYIVEKGKFLVMKNTEIIRTLTGGDFFGEIALLHNVARTATVKSISDSLIWVVEQKAYMAIRYTDRARHKKIAIEGLKQIQIFNDFKEEDLQEIVKALAFNYFKVGSSVTVKEDEIFLFVVEGTIKEDGGEEKNVKKQEFVTKSFYCLTVIEGTKIKKRQPKRDKVYSIPY